MGHRLMRTSGDVVDAVVEAHDLVLHGGGAAADAGVF